MNCTTSSTSGPRVTICVPTTGRIEYLDQAIDSLARQTRPDFEVLVLDNATTAPAVERIRQWAATDSRVRILRVDDRIPMFTNFNRGVMAATGTYTAFCHDDDCLRPTFVERHVAFMESHPSIGFSGSNYDFIDEHGTITDRSRTVRRDGIWSGLDYILRLLRSDYNPLTMQSIFFRSSALRERGFDAALGPHFGDFVLLMRIAETSDVGHLVEPLVAVRRHAGQISASVSTSSAIEIRARLLGAYCEEFEARFPHASCLSAMRAGVLAAHRKGVLRGWLEAPTGQEGVACIAALGDSGMDRAIGAVLHSIERLGLVPARRTRGMRELRRLARAVRRSKMY